MECNFWLMSVQSTSMIHTWLCLQSAIPVRIRYRIFCAFSSMSVNTWSATFLSCLFTRYRKYLDGRDQSCGNTFWREWPIILWIYPLVCKFFTSAECVSLNTLPTYISDFYIFSNFCELLSLIIQISFIYFHNCIVMWNEYSTHARWDLVQRFQHWRWKMLSHLSVFLSRVKRCFLGWNQHLTHGYTMRQIFDQRCGEGFSWRAFLSRFFLGGEAKND